MATPSKGIRERKTVFCNYCKTPYTMTTSGHALHLKSHLNNLKKTMAKPEPSPPPPQPPNAPENPLACPECAANGVERIFTSKIGRGHHRSQAHGYKGPNFKYYKKSRKKKESREIIHAKEIDNHVNGNGHSKIIPGQEVQAIFAAGYVKGCLDKFAESSNVPASLFAQGVCQLVLDHSGGGSMGTEVRLPNVRR